MNLSGYKIERCTGSGCTSFTQIDTTTSTSYSNTGLSASTTYTHRVRAYDNAGNNSSYSNTASATTQASTRTLTVNSSNPNSGVGIQVSPSDINGNGNGTTPFQRFYNNGTPVTLIAPSTASGNNFSSWTGCNSTSGTTCYVTMDADKSVTANFTPTVIRTLSVNSSNPNSRVYITVSPNDNYGQGSGTTPFTRIYNNGTSVTLTAPSTAGGNNFQKWQRNGVDYTTGLTAQVTMDADYTMTAVYTGDIIFQDDMESGTGSWYAQAPWALTTEAAHSPTHSWTDSPGGNYSNNLNVSLWSPVLNFSGLSTVTLTFWHRYDLENDYDFGRVWIWDGANFTLVASYTGINTDWTQEALDLSGFAGLPSTLRK